MSKPTYKVSAETFNTNNSEVIITFQNGRDLRNITISGKNAIKNLTKVISYVKSRTIRNVNLGFKLKTGKYEVYRKHFTMKDDINTIGELVLSFLSGSKNFSDLRYSKITVLDNFVLLDYDGRKYPTSIIIS